MIKSAIGVKLLRQRVFPFASVNELLFPLIANGNWHVPWFFLKNCHKQNFQSPLTNSTVPVSNRWENALVNRLWKIFCGNFSKKNQRACQLPLAINGKNALVYGRGGKNALVLSILLLPCWNKEPLPSSDSDLVFFFHYYLYRFEPQKSFTPPTLWNLISPWHFVPVASCPGVFFLIMHIFSDILRILCEMNFSEFLGKFWSSEIFGLMILPKIF